MLSLFFSCFLKTRQQALKVSETLNSITCFINQCICSPSPRVLTWPIVLSLHMRATFGRFLFYPVILILLFLMGINSRILPNKSPRSIGALTSCSCLLNLYRLDLQISDMHNSCQLPSFVAYIKNSLALFFSLWVLIALLLVLLRFGWFKIKAHGFSQAWWVKEGGVKNENGEKGRHGYFEYRMG